MTRPDRPTPARREDGDGDVVEDGGLRHVSWLAVGTALSRITGFVRTSVLAAALGFYTVGAAFTIGNTIPTILYTVLVGGAVSAVFVPQLVRALGHGDAEGAAYADRLLTLVIVVLGPLTVVAVGAAPVFARLYTGGGWSSADLALAAAFTAWCGPQILFYGVFAVLGQVLQARGRPGAMSWAPVVNNIVASAGGATFLVVGGIDTGAGPQASSSVSVSEIAVLGGSATAGVVVQALVLIPVLRVVGYRYRPRLDLRGSGLGRSARLALWTVVFVAANQVAYSVTVVVATTAGKAAEGTAGWAAGLPTYTNAYMIMLVPHAVVAVSLANARHRAMSRAAVHGRVAEVGALVEASLDTAGRVLVPVAAVTVALGPLLTRLLFPGTPAPDSHYLGVVLAWFSPAIIVYSAQFLLVRGLYALEDTRRPAMIQLMITGLQSALALVAGQMLPPAWVVVGLAAGFVIAYTTGLTTTVAVLRRRTGRPSLRRLGRGNARRLAAGVCAAAVGALIADRTLSVAGSGLVGTATALISAVIVLAATYLFINPSDIEPRPR